MRSRRTHSLRVLEQAELLRRIARHVAVAADAPAAPGGKEIGQPEDAVAEVGLGARAEAGDRTAGGETGELGVVEMRAMHEAPPRIGRRMVEQPRHRAPAAPRHAVVHFLALFGGVNVDRRGPIDGGDPGDEVRELRRAHRTQRVRARRPRADPDRTGARARRTISRTLPGELAKRACAALRGAAPNPPCA